MTEINQTIQIDFNQFQKEGLYLIFPNKKRIDLIHENIEELTKKI